MPLKKIDKVIAQRGWTLIECMIYCCSLACLGLLVGQAGYYYYLHVTKISDRCSLMADSYVALDALSRDLATITLDHDAWYSQELDRLIFQTNKQVDNVVGWYIKKGKLIRSQGLYDASNKRWHHKTSSLILDHINTFQCTFHHNRLQVIMNSVYGTQQCTLSRMIYVPTRQLT